MSTLEKDEKNVMSSSRLYLVWGNGRGGFVKRKQEMTQMQYCLRYLFFYNLS